MALSPMMARTTPSSLAGVAAGRRILDKNRG